MPVICITAASVNEYWERYRNAGMNAYLPKPFSEENLLRSILSATGLLARDETNEKRIEEPIQNEGSDKINLKNLYHLSDGDEQFVKQMLDSFIETTGKGFTEMSAANRAGASGQIAELAHKMLPPCRHIGAVKLSGLLKEIEDTLKNNYNNGRLEELIGKAEAEFESVRKIIKDTTDRIG
jgi:HPt (histidine-containing phosphotransfer) domain-containing protein